MSKPEPNIFQRKEEVVESAISRPGSESATFIPGIRLTADKAVSTVELPEAPSVDGDKFWILSVLIDYVNEDIAKRTNNYFDPNLNVPGINSWRNFLLWPNSKWNSMIQQTIIGDHVRYVNPFDPERNYNPQFPDSASPSKWENAFLGIRLPVSKAPLTWKDVLHVRNLLHGERNLRLRREDNTAVTLGGKRTKKRRRGRKTTRRKATRRR